MSPRLLLLTGSLLANATLLAALALRDAASPLAPSKRSEDGSSSQPLASPKPGTGGSRSQLSTLSSQLVWPSLATDDLPALIARLRAAGFPPAVIRSIIERQITARYAARLRDLEQGDPNTPFWKLSGNYFTPGDKRLEEIQQIYRERTKLIRELLRDQSLADADVTAGQRRQFGDLSPAKIDQLQRIEDDYAEMMSALRAAAQGIMLPEDREKLALLLREKNADLAAILTPEELADYDLRTSATTRYLRSRLGTFDPSDAEFRAIYSAQQAVNARFPGGAMEAQTIDQTKRDALTESYNAQLLSSLGAARYADFIRTSDQSFQQLSRLAQQNNIPPTTALLAYELRDTASRESNRILDNPALTTAQQVAALKALADTTRGQINALLGSTAGPSYARVAAQWLSALDRGSAFSTRGAPLAIISGDSTMSYNNSLIYRAPGSPTR